MVKLSLSAIALLAHATCGARNEAPSPRAVSLQSIAWLAGVWQSRAADGASLSEERWNPGGDHEMAGVGVTRVAQRLVHHELLRVVERGGSLVYIAAPKDQAVTEFVLAAIRPGFARFENQAHDFPKWVEYRREGASLEARVGGTASQRTAAWRFTLAQTAVPSTTTMVQACADTTQPGLVTVSIPPCSCVAELLCAELPAHDRDASLAVAVFDQSCEACMRAEGRCAAPALAARAARSDGGCVREALPVVYSIR